mgnify:CR=1 FL=1|jgi:hypothetical protein
MSDVFELDKVDLTQSEKFRFRVPGEKKIRELPNMNRLPIGVRLGLAEVAKPLAKAQKRGKEPHPEDVAAAAEAQVRLLERFSPGILDLIDETQAAELMKAWAGHSGISAGE